VVAEAIIPARDARQIQQTGVVLDCLYAVKPNDEILPLIRKGNVTAIHVTVAVHEFFRATFERTHGWLAFIDRHPEDLVLARSVADIERARLENRVAIIFGFQNTLSIEDDVRNLLVFKELGVRVVQLTYNERNLVGDGCTERQNSGLSDFGIQVIHELNRLGMLVDLSHVGEATANEAISVSQAPVAATHSNARRLCDTPRNLSDETIKAIGAKGGVIGINAFPGFVSRVKEGKDLTINDYLEHLDYIAGLIGPDKVGIGTDLIDGKTEADYLTPDGLMGVGRYPYKPDAYPPFPWIYPVRTIEKYPDIVEGLIRRGYSDDHIRGIMGGNFLRLFRLVWGG